MKGKTYQTQKLLLALILSSLYFSVGQAVTEETFHIYDDSFTLVDDIQYWNGEIGFEYVQENGNTIIKNTFNHAEWRGWATFHKASGLDLSGYDTLKFLAKTPDGNRRIKCGVVDFQNSKREDWFDVTNSWQEFELDVSSGLDMEHIMHAFFVVTDPSQNPPDTLFVDSVRFIQPSPPLRVNLGEDQTIGSGSTPQLVQLKSTVSGGVSPYTYRWTPIEGLDDPTVANPTATVDSTTTYSLTVTDADGETATDSVSIFMPMVALPTATGIISSAEAWSGEIVLTGDVTVAFGGKLTIFPGTIVKAKPKTDDQKAGTRDDLIEIIIDGGEMLALGTESEPITFTSAAESSEKEDWYGIWLVRGLLSLQYCNESFGVTGLHVEGSVPNVVEHCSFKYNDKGVLLEKSIHLKNCVFEENFIGIHLENGGRLDKCIAEGNEAAGVWGNGSIFLKDCLISENKSMGIDASGTIDLQECTIANNVNAGVNVSGRSGNSNQATLTDCTIAKNKGHGINVNSPNGRSNGVTLTNCTITENELDGIDINGSASNSAHSNNIVNVTNCTISGNAGVGVSINGDAVGYWRLHWGGNRYILLESNKRATIRNSTISMNGGPGLVLGGGNWYARIATLNDSQVIGNGDDGIRSGVVSATGSVIMNNGGVGVYLIAVGEKGFTDNKISTNTIGVEIKSSAEKVEGIRRNSIAANSEFDLKNSDRAEIIAGGNYWGELTIMEIMNGVTNLSMIYDRQDQSDIGPVTISGYLTQFPPKRSFQLDVPAGIGLIHIPLKVTVIDNQAIEIQKISDLYDAFGGVDTVNSIITYDTSARIWRSYLGPQHKETPADRVLTDEMGIITVMKNPVTLQLQGEALGTDGTSQISLYAGTNLIGVPLKAQGLERISDLLNLEGIKDNATTIIVSDNGTFKVVTQAGDDGDIPLTGGQSCIVNVRDRSIAEITGEAWDNTSSDPSAAPLMTVVGHSVDESTPLLVVHGTIVDKVTRSAKASFRVTVKNLSTDTSFSTAPSHDMPEGNYSVTFVDFALNRAVQVGDVLSISAETSAPHLRVQPLHHIISTNDIKASQIRLPDLIVYEIPTKTDLGTNYPNPFNPETWIPFRLAEDALVTLIIYDITGSVVRTIEVGHQPAAIYESKDKAIYWDGRNDLSERVASGVYFYTLTAGNFTATRRMLLLK